MSNLPRLGSFTSSHWCQKWDSGVSQKEKLQQALMEVEQALAEEEARLRGSLPRSGFKLRDPECLAYQPA